MHTFRSVISVVAILGLSIVARADDTEKAIRKAVERSTLNEEGTKPFHLKATVAPTLERDRGSNRTGDIEIWWMSPTQWKREVHSPGFHQVAIINGENEWQKNDGNYFPEWLRETAMALIEPVPSLDKVLEQVQEADVKKLAGSTYFTWAILSTDGNVQKGLGASIAITETTGLLFYGGGSAWGGLYKDYKNFHNRVVARTVSGGSPEVTAVITTLEDLGNVPAGFFETSAPGGDAELLHTVVVDELSLRRNLLPAKPVDWSPLKDGPLEGVLTTQIAVDRMGNVRQVGTIVSDNPAANEDARQAIMQMHFKPYLQNGAPVQVVSRVTMPFKTVRPTGAETFDSARNYFEHGRHVSFPAAGRGQPYILHATFEARVAAGSVETGQYTDTWKNDSEWRREATIGNSRFIRARHGETWYERADGPDSAMLRLVFKFIEPIPAIDTFVESDWKIRRERSGEMKTIRVLSGYESSDGSLDPVHARAYWFDENGKLLRTYFSGIETHRYEFKDFAGVAIAREIRVLHDDKVGMLIRVTDVEPIVTVDETLFDLAGNEWKREFTAEAR
jgi:hypothetical protein